MRYKCYLCGKNHSKTKQKRNKTNTMKALKIIILLMAMVLPSKIYAQNRIFTDLTNDDKIHTTFVGQAMLKLATGVLGSSANQFGVSEVDLGKLINNINSLEIVTTDNKGKVKKIQKSLNKVLKNNSNLQTVLTAPNGDKTTTVYGEVDDYTGIVSKLIVAKKEKKHMEVYVVQGSFNLTDIAGTMNLK